MNVLMLNTYDEWGGAAKAALRLSRGLQGAGIASRLLVQGKSGDARDVLGSKDPLVRFAHGVRTHLGTLAPRLYPHKPVNNFSPALLPDTLAGQVAPLAPDLVHLHWLGAGFLRIETLRRFDRPLVWTLHDSWPFTGGCHLPGDCVRYRERCGCCPVLGSRRDRDLSRWVWSRKKRAWRDLDLTLVAPSRWLADCARASSLFGDARIEVIPNGLDLTLFRPIDKRVARDLMGLAQDKNYLLFGAVNSTGDPNKGFGLLLPALQSLSAQRSGDTELIVFGAPEPAYPPPFGMKAHYLGRLHEEVSLALLYSAADLLVSPSLQENLPNTVMEAMACGTPCVAFRQGGVPELIEHRSTGYLARPLDTRDLAQGIAWTLEDRGRREALSARARLSVERNFALDLVARRYAELYRDLIERGPGGRHG